MKKIKYLLPIVFFFSCTDEMSKEKLYGKIKICDDLLIESYVIFGSGAFGGDMHSNYLTDSIHFRVFIGKEDTYNEVITVKCNGDLLSVEKLRTDEKNDSLVLLEKKILSKSKLIKEGKFE